MAAKRADLRPQVKPKLERQEEATGRAEARSLVASRAEPAGQLASSFWPKCGPERSGAFSEVRAFWQMEKNAN